MGTNSNVRSRPARGARWWTGRLVAAAAVVAVGATALAAFEGEDRKGVVVRVVDGDTLIVHVDGEDTTVRLLNIDTPETKDPDEPVQCLGPEATEFLTERLPAGTEIELEYDEERLDRYDRTLAGVYESESLINAEIAREGLGVPVLFAPNDRFLPEVEEASREAQTAQRGLFDVELECTLPGQVQELGAAVDEVPASVEGDPAEVLAEAEGVVEDLNAFLTVLESDGPAGLGNAVLAGALVEPYVERLHEEASQERERAESARGTLQELKASYDEEQERLEQERLEREQREREEREEQERLEREEQERLEREEQERLEREEQERLEQEERERKEQEQREREERERQTPEPAQQGSSSSSSSSESDSGSSSGGSDEPSSGSSPGGSSTGTEPSGGNSSGGSGSGSSGGSSGGSGSSCVPYGPEISYSDDGGYTGKRHGMPGGQTFRKCR